jgi:hypothetical protein
MSSKINIQNLFNILHPFRVHHTKNWILLSKQITHLQMKMRNFTDNLGGEVSTSCVAPSIGMDPPHFRKKLDPPIMSILIFANDNIL